jgi:UDP-N-acetyl-D-galactosamine dehydrogenase
VNAAEARHEYGLELVADGLGRSWDTVVVAVPHREYEDLSDGELSRIVGEGGLLADLKNLFAGRSLPGVERWTL